MIPAADLDAPQEAREFLKPQVHWIAHPGGYWILRNPEDVTFLQVSTADQRLIQQLEAFTPDRVMQRDGLPPQEIERLLSLLAATGMLVGTSPAKPSKRPEFNPLQLLFLRLPLFNPDACYSSDSRCGVGGVSGGGARNSTHYGNRESTTTAAEGVVGVNVRLEEGQPFMLGTKGYAPVQLGQAFLSQNVGREVLKLIPLGRFF